MKKINRYKIVTAFLFTLLIVGCTDNFEELNTNPNSVTKAPPSMLATQVILNMTKFSGRDAMAYLEGQCQPKYIGLGVTKVPAQYNQAGRGYFGLTSIPTINEMIAAAEGNPQKDSFIALAKFARATMFWGGTTQFGDIPYTEAGLGTEGNFKPKYDRQETVVLGILNELKEAEALFAKGIKFDGDPTPLAGDATKWRKVVNAYTLKILVSLSKKVDVASLDIKKRFQDIVNAGNLLDDKTYLGLVYNAVQVHPMYNNRSLYYNSAMLSSFVVNYLKRLNDYRLFYFADPAPDQINKGLKEDDMNAYVGMDVAAEFAENQANNLKKLYSSLNGRYYDVQAPEPRFVLTYAEQQLIIAEARVRGWITNGSAKDYYESGVKSVLANYMATDPTKAHGKPITQAYINSYFSGEAGFAATSDNQLKQIWLQLYLIGFMQPSSADYDYRLHAYPEFPLNPLTNLNPGIGGGYPMRSMYPDTEYSYNVENLKAALDQQWSGVDDTNNIMWILK